MFKDIIRWRFIRAQVLKGGVSKRQAARDAGIHWSTLEKILKHPFPPKFNRKKRQTRPKRLRIVISKQEDIATDIKDKIIDSVAFIRDMIQVIPRSAVPVADLRSLTRLLLESGFAPPDTSSKFHNPDSENHQWMQLVMQKKLSFSSIQGECGHNSELQLIAKKAWSGSLAERKKAVVVLAKLKGISSRSICRFFKSSDHAIQDYWGKFQAGGSSELFNRKSRPKQAENGVFRSVFLSLLHSPPSAHGINRTSWKWDDLLRCLRMQGYASNKDTLREIVKSAGFRWRQAKVVLTSNDPEYREKLEHLKGILSTLGRDERFFSIDEFGPFALKKKAGKQLVAPGEYPSVAQFQKSKGWLIVTAALELSRNQVTHFYSKKKNTVEMIKLLEVLVEQYGQCKKLYVSWDAASWHASEKLYEIVKYHNAMAAAGNNMPLIELVPLPASAQFLNVIESVFSGMAKAIIHNSDYQSEDDAKAAIDRYFQERNIFFQSNPKRAGNKIWGHERVPSVFAEDQNCKDPKWSR